MDTKGLTLPHAWQKYLVTFKLMSQVVQRARPWQIHNQDKQR